MSVFALDFSDELLQYPSIHGHENLHLCGRLIRVLHVLKTAKRQENSEPTEQENIDSSTSTSLNIIYKLPTKYDLLNLAHKGLQYAKTIGNNAAYRQIWEFYGGKIENEVFDKFFVESQQTDELYGFLQSNLDEAKLSQIHSNLRPVIEDMINLFNRSGDFPKALKVLMAHPKAWGNDHLSNKQFCQLYASTAVLATASSGSSEHLKFCMTLSTDFFECKVAAALLYFMNAEFAEALNRFQKLQPKEKSLIAAIVNFKDIALYTALSSMATRRGSAPSSNPKEATTAMIEIVSCLPASRDALLKLSNCEYSSVVEYLSKSQKRMMLDPFIAPVWHKVSESIKQRIIVEFTSAFTSIHFNRIASDTGIDINEIESVLLSAIKRKELIGRLDLSNKSYTKRREDSIARVFAAEESMDQGFQSAVQSTVIEARFKFPTINNSD